ncbi:MAG TPA: FxsA family protein [Casimicrobiaceae bacterium]|nr:FxsA family protein [Casimicrobiaceae bacterium]
MRFALLLVILLGFPIADLYATVRFAQWSGVPVWVWLTISVFTGLALLRNERMTFRTHVVAALHGDQSLLRGVVDSGRRVLAGILLLLPGVVSDGFALMLLLLPLNIGHRDPLPAHAGRTNARGGAAIDGEFRRVE